MALTPLLDAARLNTFPAYLKPQADELDVFVDNILSEALSGKAGINRISILRQILQTSGKTNERRFQCIILKLPLEHFLSENSFHALVQKIVHIFCLQVDQALHEPTMSLQSFDLCIDLLQNVLQSRPHLLFSGDITAGLIPHAFVFGYLLPRCYDMGSSQTDIAVQKIWTEWLEQASPDSKEAVSAMVKEKLGDLLVSTEARPR
jgi:hypothetical protein